MSEKRVDLELLRHSAAHLLAAAVLELWPDALPTIGPAIKNGFYYDFDFSGYAGADKRPASHQGATRVEASGQNTGTRGKAPSVEDLPKIEKKMREILPSWTNVEKIEETKASAQSRYKGNPYKNELIQEIAERGEKITTYKMGSFKDLCRGGHVERPAKEINPEAFKLTHIAGAYWRGDEKNAMLTRIYGVAFATKEELEAHLQRREEAKKRDHRKLGPKLDLFTFSELVGPGLPLFTPKGTVIRTELQEALFAISKKYGMQAVTIPHLAKRQLYEISGHAEKFAGELFSVKSHYDTEFVLKPVNCPHHTQIYAARPRSYRDLPLRYMESTMQYRDEKPGEIMGLTRARGFMVDDGHIFCTVPQIKQEAKNICRIIEEFYTALGMWGSHWVSLSVRDKQTPEKYIGEPKDWDQAEAMLQEISDELGLNAKRMEGEAALYGPKLDYMFEDALGNERQLATVQIDFSMPKRFSLSYKDADGSDKNPVMLHRAILGSYERFLAILIEHFAGAFPVWLAPVQVRLLPVAERHNEKAEKIQRALEEAGVRNEVASAVETIGKRIRESELLKIPYIAVLGDKESEREVTIRQRGVDEQRLVPLAALVEEILSHRPY